MRYLRTQNANILKDWKNKTHDWQTELTVSLETICSFSCNQFVAFPVSCKTNPASFVCKASDATNQWNKNHKRGRLERLATKNKTARLRRIWFKCDKIDLRFQQRTKMYSDFFYYLKKLLLKKNGKNLFCAIRYKKYRYRKEQKWIKTPSEISKNSYT